MKKQLLLLSGIVMSCGAFAQITINSSDGPVLNQVTITRTDSTSTTGPGANGPSITWNFGSLLNQDADTILFGPVSGTPAAASFSTSNLCIANPLDTTWTYITNGTSALTIDGFQIQNAGSPLIFKYNPPQKLIDYPSTYMSTLTNVAKASVKMAINSPPFDSVWLKQTINQSSAINAWGTLTTPSGTYNALRQDYVDINTDSAFGRSFGVWQFLQVTKDTASGSRWWANGVGFTIMDQELNPQTGAVLRTNYMHITTVGQNESLANTPFILCFPNPASNELNFMTKENEGAEIIVTDMQGRVIEKILVDEQTEKLNTASWAEGIYHYTLFSAKHETLSGKIVVTH